MTLTLNDDDRDVLVQTLTRFAAAWGTLDFVPGDELLEAAERMITPAIGAEWIQRAPETIGGGPPGTLGMMIVRRRRQLVYSLKLSNFLRDPVASGSATALAVFAATYMPSALANPPPTFPGFLIGLTFALLRSVAHPVGYGEAALLNQLNRIAERKGIVPLSDPSTLGKVLVEEYGYVKGQNSNEIESLVASRRAWGAVEDVKSGLKIRETVPFGLGPLEYVD